MKLSACIVIRNEEKLLPRCLRSIEGVVDEIVVVHDGPCQDKSLEIARKYGARVYTRPFVGEAEHHRPFSFDKARGEWILQIDADEFLSLTAQKEIGKLIKADHIDAYSFLWPYPANNGYIKRGPFAKTVKPCLFRKSKLFMIGISHEYPRTYGALQKRPDILLEHKPEYDNFTLAVFKEKWLNWAKLNAYQIANIDKAPTFNIKRRKNNSYLSYDGYIKKYPLVSGIKETIRFVMIYLARGLIIAGRRSLKIALFELAYLWLVRFNIIRISHGKEL